MRTSIAVLFIVAALSLGFSAPALAQFVQGDLTGDWTIHGLSTANVEDEPAPGNWFRGSLSLSNTGVVLGGSIELSDGSPLAVTGGKLTVGASGLINGTLIVAGTVVNVRATMIPDKNGVLGVAADGEHLRNETFALVRQTAASSSTTDLAGQWLVYAISTPDDVAAAGSSARGALTFDATGALVSPAVLTRPGGASLGGVDQITGGALTVSSVGGGVQGSFTGVAEGSSPAEIVYTISGMLEPGKEVIVGVATREVVETGARLRSFFVAMKATDPVTIADLAGTWRTYLHIVLHDDGEFGAWLEGPVVIRGTDGVVSGMLRNADGTTAAISGALAIRADGDPATRLFGDVVILLLPPDTQTAIPLPARFEGGVSPARDRIASSVFINIVVGPNRLTIDGLAAMVRQPVSTVQFPAVTFTGREGSTAQVTVTRTGTVGTVSVDWATTTTGSGTPGVDYTAAGGTVTFPNGAATATFTIDLTHDLLFEGNETINLVLRNPRRGAVIGPRSASQLVIVDDEQRVQFAASSAAVTVNEGVPSVTLTLTRTGPPLTPFTVPVTVDGGTAVSGLDYPATLETGLAVSFAVNQASKTFSVPLRDDPQRDGVKTLGLRLGTPSASNVLLGAQQTSTLTIVDNESGAVRFAAAASSIREGGTARINVTRSGTNLQAGIDITYTVIGGTAATGDYTILGTGTLSFGPRQTTQTITVQTTSDTLHEPSETVIIQLGNPQGLAVLTAPTTHTLTIVDNDRPGVLRFTASSIIVPEPQGASRDVQLIVTRAAALPIGSNFASGVTVDYTVTGGDATGSDFTLLGTGTLTFEAGEASKTIGLQIHADDVPEGTENIVVTLSQPTGGATLGSPSTITIGIGDEDRAVYFASNSVTVTEATLSVAITLLRSGPTAGGFTVPVNIAASSTAVAGFDYPATFTGVAARFTPGQKSATVRIPLFNDALLDGTKSLALELGTPVPIAPALIAPAVGTRRSMTIQLGDNDTPGQIGFVALASAVNEGATARIVVGRKGVNLARNVTVRYRVANTTPPPTATEGVDFEFVDATRTVTFGPGATSAFIDVRALPDDIEELPEKFTIELFENSHGILIGGRTRQVVTINDAN